jgi:hypothetical protein
MKPKLRACTAKINTGMPFHTNAGNPAQANKSVITIIKKVRKKYNESDFEDFILSEFGIDSETMEEHLQELHLFIVRQNLINELA